MTLTSAKSQQTGKNGMSRNKLDDYRIICKVGEGTYGQVFKAEHLDTRELVALKKLVRFANDEDGLPFTSIREIKFLQFLKSEKNIVQLKDAFFSPENELVCVFEWMDHDLSGLISTRPSPFPISQVKCYMKQLLEALFTIHQRGLMHRDIKAANMLLNNKGGLYLADFGLMTSYTGRNVFTNNVITRWYKPPEILLGAVNYGPAVDMWGVGCVLVEMLTGKTPFPGSDDANQLEVILRGCGTAQFIEAEKEGSDFAKLKDFKKTMELVQRKFAHCRFEGIRKMPLLRAHKVPDEAYAFLEELLAVDPKKRISAQAALDHDFFWQGEPVEAEANMPSYPSVHEYEVKQRRAVGNGAASSSSNAANGNGHHHHHHHH